MRALLSAILALAVAPPLHAEEGGAGQGSVDVVVVAVGEGEAGDRLAADVEARMRALVAKDGRYRLRSLRAFTGPTPEEAIARAAALVEQGRAAYLELETEAATSALSEAVEILLHHIDALDERETLHDAIALLASVHHQSGETERARELFTFLLTLAPGYSLAEGAFPPSDAKLLLELQAELAFAEPGGARIDVEGSRAAAVWIDGTYRGATPLVVEPLAPGPHAYLLRREGYAPKSGRFVVEAVARRDVRVKLDPTFGASALEGIVLDEADTFHESLATLARAAGDPAELLVAVVEGDAKASIRIARILPARRLVVRTETIAAGQGNDAALENAVRALLDAPIPEAALAAAEGSDDHRGEPFDATPWIWTGAAASVIAVAALATGGALIWALSHEDGASSQSPATDPHALARRRVVLGF